MMVIILGFFTAVCIAIDGLHPRGRLYNVHKRAANELFALQDKIVTQWNQIRLLSSNQNDENQKVAAMLEEVQTEKQRINKYITNVEASLGEQEQASKS